MAPYIRGVVIGNTRGRSPHAVSIAAGLAGGLAAHAMSPAEEIGVLAVAMKKIDLKIRAWMIAEGKEGRLRRAADSPDWAAYQDVQAVFDRKLHEEASK